ncbi:MAG TPA: 2,3-bisphosphoglycerate-independent phosphoglycerate mutase [Candidatus Bathyarchaeota archaeon]|nr:2,3-bisphosphoglycerate-independent phosphoglycerate mutase [Candidatus Bathyarchaeota archaeon]
MKRVVFIILDGLGDRPIADLGYKTPLQTAFKPNIDKLASKGIVGLVHPISPGVPPGSDSAHLAYFGYNPTTENPGRGSLEALGYGIKIGYDTIAFRVNFATLSGDVIIDRRAGRIESEYASQLAEEVNQEIKSINGFNFKLINTLDHRGILLVSGSNVSREVTDTDPHTIGVPPLRCKPLEAASSPENAIRTANAVNRYLRRVRGVLCKSEVNKHRMEEGKPPANVILIRGAGVKPSLESFHDRWGFKAACIAGGPLYKGVAAALGMDVINVPGATGRVDSNFSSKFKHATRIIKEYDFVFIHIKATDIASHDRKPLLKVELIEKIDHEMEILSNLSSEDVLIVLTGDHSTSCITGMHTGDPVPILFHGGVRIDEVKSFDEVSAIAGGLGFIRGLNIMPLVLNAADRAEEFGIKTSSKPRMYRMHYDR